MCFPIDKDVFLPDSVKKNKKILKKFFSIFRPPRVVDPLTLAVIFSELRWKSKNRIEDVNCIVLSYSMIPHMAESAQRFWLFVGVLQVLVPPHLIFRSTL